MRLRDLFKAVAVKRLSAVEADPKTSNQHEFKGVQVFRTTFGDAKRSFDAEFLYLADESEPVRGSGITTWYDAREHTPHRSAEFRLYFTATDASRMFRRGDVLIVALREDRSMLVVAAPPQSTVSRQLVWLFGLDEPTNQFKIEDLDDRGIDFVSRWVLDSIGVDSPPAEADPAELTRRFGNVFPSTREFAAFAREQCADADHLADPDGALVAWLDMEERLFRALERAVVATRIGEGFRDVGGRVDVDAFMAFSLSVHNRRKARAGFALENHLEFIFQQMELRYARGALTEATSKPDFLFPGQKEYRDDSFPVKRLAVLGAKATCKDRWRQVIGEADRIKHKHLLTLEPSITEAQTGEMQSRHVQLVLPRAVHLTYTSRQQEWLWTLADFVDHVKRQQR